MSEVIERVARAICAKLHAGDFAREAPTLDAYVSVAWRSYSPAARAAIEAMREPTEGVVAAILPVMPTPYEKDAARAAIVRDYGIMIDAALKDPVTS